MCPVWKRKNRRKRKKCSLFKEFWYLYLLQKSKSFTEYVKYSSMVSQKIPNSCRKWLWLTQRVTILDKIPIRIFLLLQIPTWNREHPVLTLSYYSQYYEDMKFYPMMSLSICFRLRKTRTSISLLHLASDSDITEQWHRWPIWSSTCYWTTSKGPMQHRGMDIFHRYFVKFYFNLCI